MSSSDPGVQIMDIGDSMSGEDIVQVQSRKDEFLVMLAHELRNPLASIRIAVEVLRRLNLQEPRAEWSWEVVDRQAAQLTRIVDDLLDVSRITRGKITLRQAPLNFVAVIVRAIEVNLPLIKARRLDLIVESEPLGIDLDGDEVRLTQALANILNNAAKYSNDGGRIWLSVEVESGEAAVRIKDEGIGIPPELLPHIFDLFIQGPRTLDRTQGGLGSVFCWCEAWSRGTAGGWTFAARTKTAAPSSSCGCRFERSKSRCRAAIRTILGQPGPA